MKTMIEETFLMIQKVLNEEVYDKPLTKPKETLQLIIENGLSGMLYEAIDASLFEEHYHDLLKKSYFQYISKDLKQFEVIKDVKDIFNHQEIKHVFLKGAHIKELYPKSYMRGMGDIDVLVHQSDYISARKALISSGYKLIEKYYYHDTFQNEQGIKIELHPRIQHDFEIKYKGMFLHPFNNLIQDKNYTYKFEPEYELMYLLYHLAKHIYNGGIGLRSILDIYIYTKTQDFNLDKLDKYLSDASLKKFFEFIMSIHLHYFNETLEMSHFNFKNFSDDEIFKICDHIVHRGIHGRSQHNDLYQEIVNLHEMNKTKNKFKYLLKTIFRSYKLVSTEYRIIKYLPFLLPFYWMYRAIYLMTVKFGSSIRKLKVVLTQEETQSIKRSDYYL